MAGLDRFLRRYGWWVALRARLAQAQRPLDQAELSQPSVASVLKVLSLYIAAMLLALIVSMVLPGHACAQQVATDQIPAKATAHRLQLRREAQRVWGLDAPVATFAAQIHQESRWRLDAVSPVGAEGLAQFMPKTAGWIGTVDLGLAGAQTMNPTWSLRALVTYDRWLWVRVKADGDCERMAYVLSSYNGGLGWVYKRQKLSKVPGVCMGQTCTINPGIHPASQRENELYPRLILLRYEPLYATWGKGACNV